MLNSSIKANVITFNGLTPKMFETLKNKGEENHLPFNGDKGSVDAAGIKADYDYQSANQSLTVTVTDKPRFLLMSMVTNRVSVEITKLLNAPDHESDTLS